jgi:NodT family efflux transporter outer membrane factor (OMF) lipoprotein
MMRALSLGLAVGLAGCATYLERRHDEPLTAIQARYDERPSPGIPGEPPPEQPSAIAAPPSYEASGAMSPLAWGTALGDPSLDAVLAEALADNLDVRAAVTRVLQAQAVADQVRAARLPQITFQTTGSYATSVSPPFGRRNRTWSVNFSLPMSYQVDLFGRYALDSHAARLDADAAELDAETAGISVAASASEAWFDLVEIHARKKVLEAQLETNRTYLELVTLRFDRGLTSSLDVHQQEQLVASSEAQLALVDGEEAVLQNQLSVLVGATPDRTFAEGHDALPELPAAPSVGVPSDLLERRPDLQAAYLRLRSADMRVASAVRAQLPSLSLNLTPSFIVARSRYAQTPSTGGGTGTILNQGTIHGWGVNVGGTFTAPIFDGLRSPAVAHQRRAQTEEALAIYRQTYLTALSEVENSVALERQQRLNIQYLERQLGFARATLEAAEERYRAGLSDYLPVLSALSTTQQLELGLLAARRQLISNRLQLYRALGAAWSPTLELHE